MYMYHIYSKPEKISYMCYFCFFTALKMLNLFNFYSCIYFNKVGTQETYRVYSVDILYRCMITNKTLLQFNNEKMKH